MRNNMIIATIICSCLLLMLVSCAGVRGTVVAAKVDKPVSFTPCVFDAKGSIIKSEPKDTLKHFKLEKCYTGMLFTIISLDGAVDISDELNQEITSVQGDAIVNLTLETKGDNWAFFSALIPIIPSALYVDIQGDVVRLQPEPGVK